MSSAISATVPKFSCCILQISNIEPLGINTPLHLRSTFSSLHPTHFTDDAAHSAAAHFDAAAASAAFAFAAAGAAHNAVSYDTAAADHDETTKFRRDVAAGQVFFSCSTHQVNRKPARNLITHQPHLARHSHASIGAARVRHGTAAAVGSHTTIVSAMLKFSIHRQVWTGIVCFIVYK